MTSSRWRRRWWLRGAMRCCGVAACRGRLKRAAGRRQWQCQGAGMACASCYHAGRAGQLKATQGNCKAPTCAALVAYTRTSSALGSRPCNTMCGKWLGHAACGAVKSLSCELAGRAAASAAAAVQRAPMRCMLCMPCMLCLTRSLTWPTCKARVAAGDIHLQGTSKHAAARAAAAQWPQRQCGSRLTRWPLAFWLRG